ncbi:hypothetical protein [Massilia sp. YMA4]|uniref:Uncharacterized protein n=1 Tax=[Empedobacter] haloabium TaxID=592317 RepID=A0ABZ1UTH9_9BURK|nr:hypothetical protein [Massilia sp. YMA4]
MLSRVDDVEKAQRYFAEASNRNAGLAHDNDRLRTETEKLEAGQRGSQ